jgi:hypothetical protein
MLRINRNATQEKAVLIKQAFGEWLRIDARSLGERRLYTPEQSQFLWEPGSSSTPIGTIIRTTAL